MFNIASLIIGIVTLVLAVVAFLPLLGWANWFIIPLAAIGTVIGLISSHTSGRTLNLIVLGICIVRLMMGGGIF